MLLLHLFLHERARATLAPAHKHERKPCDPSACGYRRENAYASWSAATPGRTLPSRSSSEAPPPVEMCDILSARPAFSTAATESPPPMIVMQPLEVRSASVSQIANVPLAKASISNTPMGPFQITVLQSANLLWISSVALGPLSRPIQPSGMASWATTCVLASASNLSA